MSVKLVGYLVAELSYCGKRLRDLTILTASDTQLDEVDEIKLARQVGMQYGHAMNMLLKLHDLGMTAKDIKEFKRNTFPKPSQMHRW